MKRFNFKESYLTESFFDDIEDDIIDIDTTRNNHLNDFYGKTITIQSYNPKL